MQAGDGQSGKAELAVRLFLFRRTDAQAGLAEQKLH